VQRNDASSRPPPPDDATRANPSAPLASLFVGPHTFLVVVRFGAPNAKLDHARVLHFM
jgi:hypothetical protein